jgi:PAS domain S-box-containing protein
LINLNRLFSWLSIRTKLIVAFAGLSVLPIIVVGIFAIWSTASNLTETAKRNLNNDVQTLRHQAGDFLSGVETDMRFLSGSSQFRSLDLHLAKNDNPGKDGMKSLESELLDLARTKKSYYRLRLLDKSGTELLRVEASSDKSNPGTFMITPERDLSRAREYYYLFLTDSLKDGQIVFSPAEVLGNTGSRIAVVSFATPLYEGNEKTGILIADVYASTFFRIMEADSTHEYGKRVLLVSGDGHFLYDSQRKKDWDKLFMLARDNIRSDYPDSISTELLSGRTGLVTKGIEQVVSYSPLFQMPIGNGKKDFGSGFSVPLFVIEAIPKEILMKPVYSATIAFGAAILGFLILSVTLSLLATSQFTKPIAEMRKGAEIISNGNYQHRLRIETRDEIEKLADQFNTMAESLMVRDEELQNHRESLERKVAERTKELFDEKSKLQTILDNVPSALLVLDRKLTIQTVSAAFAKVTGYQPEEVIGKDCCDFFCKSGFCQTCVSENVIQTGKVEGHMDQVVGPDGTDRYVEHFAVPMEKDGKVEAVLEIVSDVTNRKRLEQHLVKTEKLATMGELAAFIAHEFRNSLTSIKMILQLFNESQDLDRSKKESLTVALNSAYRMESTVSELLGFAKPTKMEFKITSVNQVIEDSITFVKLRADKAKVEVEKNLETPLPDLSLDVVHLREALVNIILNAVQAIENRDFASPNRDKLSKSESRISISTRRSKLGRTVRDFAYVELVQSASDTQADLQEIVLKKGTDCVQIEVSDTGPGIERANLLKIFDPFFTTKPNGTGLGLSMAKRVVNGHGGIIIAESRIGIGTKFRIILPLVQQTLVAGVA